MHHQHNREMYDRYGERYHAKRQDETQNLWNEYLDIPTLTRLIENRVNGWDVLDLGCGSGLFCAKVKGWGAHVVGLDLSEAMIEIARRENPTIAFYVGNAEALPFGDRQFDFVYSGLMIHYFKHLNPLFAEVARVLRPSGRFVFSFHHPFNEVIEEVREGDRTPVILHPYFHCDRYTWNMFGEEMELVSYHHTFTNIFTELNHHNFLVENLIETTPSPDLKHKYPRFYARTSRYPSFCAISAVSQGT